MHVGNNSEDFLNALASHKGIVYKVANSYSRNDASKKDLIQEIIVQLWLSFDKYDDDYKLSTWIYRIALNVSISYYRKEKRRRVISQPLPDELLHIDTVEKEVSKQPEVEKLQRLIKELKELDRAIIMLSLDGYDQQEIADIMGISVTNVSTRKSRAKKKLRQKFETDT
ncbi:RNA polymerase sigma factor [Fodinibius halophilus]|uniref:Sigma-70 family RNA polymerase sigma factor n=1 Tax=Fodinibius halophilus TaxID=1736908 RepID=A0A6M1TGM6_9BACT|nr:sigma-70 family RNA polymerase sigma factor [Fodinibius halophilus]NGP89924.1 sigma-70 family RNA polymerase sigma factor [Fodinibius halophilus]